MEMDRHRRLRRGIAALELLLLLIALAALLYLRWEQPPTPAIEPAEQSDRAAAQKTDETEETQARIAAEAVVRGRKQGVYTILLAGRDEASGCTDTILLARLDTRQHSLDLVSIPRDTLINLAWPVRKLNAVFAGAVNTGKDPVEALRRELRRLCGFSPDCCAVADLTAFAEAVDLIGGIEYELPEAMHYDDPTQDLHIHLDAGARRLNGEEAVGLVRYRAGYLNGDLDRLEVQQRFLDAAIGQVLSLGSVPRLPELAELIAAHTDTDLTAANIAWLLRQTLQCRREDVRFHIAPTTPATVAGLSYTLLEPEAWISMINDCLNPYAAPITRENLDLVYHDADGYHATSGDLRGADYYSNEEFGIRRSEW